MVSEMKIGLLVPQSKQYPALDRDFVRGIKLSGLEGKYYVESIGRGADDKLIIDKIQKMSLQEDIQVIIAFFGHRDMDNVYAYTSQNDILLIVSEIGATLPYAMAPQPGVFINSLGLTESAYLLGGYFSTAGQYRNIAISSSYYDVGYGIQSALEMALYPNDLQFSGHYITPFYPRENEAECMSESIHAGQPDAVFAFHSGTYAKEHASYIDSNQLTAHYPFYLTSFSVNNDIIQQYGSGLNHVFLVGSWLEGAKDESACTFTKHYREVHGQLPGAFSLLGYESGLFVKALLESTSGTGPRALATNAYAVSVEGPRGTIQFQPETNRTVYDHYIFRMTVDAEANHALEQIEVLQNDGSFIQDIIKQDLPEQMGGWHNAYLCH
jgi:branched-chain amino acid transport system substrate-binding protein